MFLMGLAPLIFVWVFFGCAAFVSLIPLDGLIFCVEKWEYAQWVVSFLKLIVLGCGLHWAQNNSLRKSIGGESVTPLRHGLSLNRLLRQILVIILTVFAGVWDVVEASRYMDCNSSQLVFQAGSSPWAPLKRHWN